MEQKTVRHEKEKRKLLKCPFPGCVKVFEPVKDSLPFCPYHRQLAVDVAFVVATVNIKRGPPMTKSGIVLAGSTEAQQIMRKRRV